MTTLLTKRIVTCIALTAIFGSVACASDVDEPAPAPTKNDEVKVAPVESQTTPQSLCGGLTCAYKCPLDCISATTLAECQANCSGACTTARNIQCY